MRTKNKESTVIDTYGAVSHLMLKGQGLYKTRTPESCVEGRTQGGDGGVGDKVFGLGGDHDLTGMFSYREIGGCGNGRHHGGEMAFWRLMGECFADDFLRHAFELAEGGSLSPTCNKEGLRKDRIVSDRRN